METNGFYAYDDFLALARRLGIHEKIAYKVLKEFLSKSVETLALLERSFLSTKAKQQYRSLYLDRVKALYSKRLKG